MGIRWSWELEAPTTIKWRGNGVTVAGGLPENIPAMVDVDEKLDGARLRDQLDVANTDGVPYWPAVACLDDRASPATGHRRQLDGILAPATYGANGGLR